MTFVHERTDSGLLVARESAEGAAVARALRDHDPDLRLVPQFSQTLGRYWSVYRYAGSEREAEFVCAWVDYERDEPKPLSFGLVERVKELDRNLRGPEVDHDAANERVRAEGRRQAQADAQAAAEDWVARERRSALLPRGQSLRRARARTGYHERT